MSQFLELSPNQSEALNVSARAHLPEDARRRILQLEAAAQVGRQLTLLQDVEHLLAKTADVLRETFGYYQTHILLVDETTNELVLKEVSGPAADLLKRLGLRLKRGEGITGWVIESGEPKLVNDVRQEPRYYGVELVPDTRAELAVPLRLGERIIGVLDVQSEYCGAFREEDITALQLIGDQVAIALENARLFQETRSRLAAMQALHEVSLDIVAQLELSQLLQTLLQRAARLTQAAAVAVYVREKDSEWIYHVANYRTRTDWTGNTVRLGEGHIGRVVQTGEAIIIHDYSHWPHALPQFAKSVLSVRMAVPMRWQGQVIGCLLVLNPAEGHKFTIEDQEVLEAFADLAAIALKNAELYTQVKSFNQRLEAQVSERTQELVQARRLLLEKSEQVQWLLSKTVHIQEEERVRIARDLHDSVTQLTIGALYELQAAKVDMEARATGAAREKVDMARDLLKEIERELRQAIYDLRPALLDASGLAPALQKYVANFQELTGIQTQVQIVGAPIRLPSPIEVVIFRIAQEALHNVMAHAHAKTVNVTLDCQPTQLCLRIGDDGQGFELAESLAQQNNGHWGLLSMRERAAVIGGQLEVWSKRGEGARVTLCVPCGSKSL
jgi:signal transduction histidine kinase